MNPIEKMLSKWKGEIRNMRSENSEELYQNITAASSLITSSDCSGYYRVDSEIMLKNYLTCSRTNDIFLFSGTPFDYSQLQLSAHPRDWERELNRSPHGNGTETLRAVNRSVHLTGDDCIPIVCYLSKLPSGYTVILYTEFAEHFLVSYLNYDLGKLKKHNDTFNGLQIDLCRLLSNIDNELHPKTSYQAFPVDRLLK
ncbi:hypothetical protein RF11_04155 [Thelohanellus kitauei]|uniref:Uncharacterized protein n=1 Tax=Thelohanellus kitauei TaxID=669202 RepID=A0A0C2NJ07_THEKT|nr:hypothetical protein RF11_04155 [Thelohanellus kitauei]